MSVPSAMIHSEKKGGGETERRRRIMAHFRYSPLLLKKAVKTFINYTPPI